MRFDILALFPELFEPFAARGIIGRAAEDRLLDFGFHNIRDFAEDKHKTVDDTPYGGGAGMILKIEPIAHAIDSISEETHLRQGSGGRARNKPPPRLRRAGKKQETKRRTVVLAARGEQFTQAKAEEYAKLDQLVLICGRYEGIDQRVADHLADEELSIGPYVLNGGEVAAMAVIETIARLLPNVLGNQESLLEESHSAGSQKSKVKSQNYVEYPQYTKPEEYNGWKVPEVLLSGNHAEIEKWRKKMAR